MLKSTESSDIGMDSLQCPADAQDGLPLNEELRIDSAVFGHHFLQPPDADLSLPKHIL